MDYQISKPKDIAGYENHRLVAGLTDGKPVQFADQGEQLLIRTDASISGEVIGFKLKACVGVKVNGKHRYFPTSDRSSRHDWLNRKAAQNGFEVLTVYISGGMQRIKAHDGRNFTVDSTEFIGALRITDKQKFDHCIKHGIGNKAKAFGFGLLSI